MRGHARQRSADLPAVNITDVRRQRLFGRAATATTILAAFIAVLVVSGISVVLGFLL
jgi:hypothetical protein